MREEAIHITAKRKGPAVLITAGVHGDEYEPMLAVEQLSRRLQKLLTSGTVILMPIVNISAYRTGKRTGTDKLDLARVCPGKKQGSVTEQCAARVSNLIRHADYYIDMHTGGAQLEIYPLAGYMLHNDQNVLRKQRSMALAFNLPAIWGTDPYLEGRTLSIARDANVPAIYVEYGGGQEIRSRIIDAYFRGCINVLRILRMIETTSEIKPGVKYWVEDHRRNQGHLQSKTPSPASGIFFPSVSVGDTVQQGQEWGKIKDVFTFTEHSVCTDRDGLVLFLRAQPYVKKGDSLGGILPISKPGKIIFK